MPQVSKAYAVRLGTIDLYAGWEESVLLETQALSEQIVQFLHCRRACACMSPERSINKLRTPNATNHHCALRAAMVELLNSPSYPTILTSCVTRSITFDGLT